MPAWKTFDEQTAAALKQRLEERVSIEKLSQPLFENGDSVIVAPTLQKGAALVITARRKAPTPAPTIFEPASAPALQPAADGNSAVTLPQSFPAVDASPLPELSQPEAPLPFAADSGSIENQAPATEPSASPVAEEEPAESIFGPTTWERAETSDPVPADYLRKHETSSTDPEVWDIPSEAPRQPWDDPALPQDPVVDTTPTWEDDRHVATGFLGLDDYVEDEEEIARAKRPWWKKIFSD